VDAVEVEGLRIAYTRAGQGPPLLLLQGFVGDGRATWGAQLEALSDAFTVVVWDAPGAGRSDTPPESFGMADFADCASGFAEALGLRTPVVGGLSFGGALALEVYRRYPALPAALILVNGYAGWAGSLPADVVADRLQLSLDLAERPAKDVVAALLPTMFSASAPPDRVAAFAKSMIDFNPAGFRTMARASAEADLRDVLPQVAVPTLVVHGEADVRAPRPVADALHSGIVGSRLVVLPGVGHAATVEAADVVTAEMRSFLHSI
jgi:pimeloyl-ACP methyl ester carboxylesterase